MTYEEYQAAISGMTAENFQTIASDLLSEIKHDCETLSSMTEKCSSQDMKIRDLQDTNAKLFLSITKPVTEKAPEDEKTALAEKEIAEARAKKGLDALF